MTSVSQEDEFTEVTHKRKKRKATGSPTLPTLQKTGSSELPPGTPTRPKPAIIKNNIPVILSGIKAEHKNWRKLLGELRQFHPGLKVSQIKELPKGDFLIITLYNVCAVPWGVLSTVGGVQYRGGYHEYRGGIS